MSTSEHVKAWRRNTKAKLVAGFGGGCNRCGYSTHQNCLDLHHRNPSTKSFSFGSAMAHPKSWNALVEEARKCILLCRNCHGEFHAGIWFIDEIMPVEFRAPQEELEAKPLCAVCKKPVKTHTNICCSVKCSAKRACKIDWPTKAKFRRLLKKYSQNKIAFMFGVSEMAVRKRKVKYGIVGTTLKSPLIRRSR